MRKCHTHSIMKLHAKCCYAECCYTERCHTEGRYAEWHSAACLYAQSRGSLNVSWFFFVLLRGRDVWRVGAREKTKKQKIDQKHFFFTQKNRIKIWQILDLYSFNSWPVWKHLLSTSLCQPKSHSHRHNKIAGTIFTTLHFLHNLRMGSNKNACHSRVFLALCNL